MSSPQPKKGCRQLKKVIEDLKTKFRELYTVSNTDLKPEDTEFKNCVDTHNKYYELSTFVDEYIKLKSKIPNLKIAVELDIPPDQIATKKEEITPNTKAYIGPLYPNIFKELPKSIEKVFTDYPEGEVYIIELTIPNEYKTAEQHIQELKELGFAIDEYSDDMLREADLREGLGQTYRIVIPSIKSLGFPNRATRQESQDRAIELGLAATDGKTHEHLPAIVGIELRKQYKNQPQDEHVAIDMKSVFIRSSHSCVFRVGAFSGRRWLRASYGWLDSRWNSDSRWAFLAN